MLSFLCMVLHVRVYVHQCVPGLSALHRPQVSPKLFQTLHLSCPWSDRDPIDFQVMGGKGQSLEQGDVPTLAFP